MATLDLYLREIPPVFEKIKALSIYIAHLSALLIYTSKLREDCILYPTLDIDC